MTAKTGDTTSKLEKALIQVRNLIESLHASDSSEPGELGIETIAFHYHQLGGIMLSGNEARRYRECLDALAKIHGTNADIAPLSRSAMETLMRLAILRTLRPTSEQTISRATFKRRIDRELRRLRAEIEAPPTEWIVTVRVDGFDPETLPLTFGGVKFVAGTNVAARTVASGITDFEPKRRVAKAKFDAEQRARAESRAELAESLSGATIATVPILAIDIEAARRLGIERTRRTIDVLNYFARYFDDHADVPRAFMAPEGQRPPLTWFVRRTDGESYSFRYPLLHLTATAPIRIRPDSQRATSIGFSRADQILAAGSPGDMESRIVNALIWAGRASVEHRRDIAFLLYMISLEALLTKQKARGGVTDRLRLRLAHLIGPSPKARQRIFDLMTRFYEARSALVHSGDSNDITDVDLQMIRKITQSAITRALTDSRFANIRQSRDFERWLDEQLLVGSQ